MDYSSLRLVEIKKFVMTERLDFKNDSAYTKSGEAFVRIGQPNH